MPVPINACSGKRFRNAIASNKKNQCLTVRHWISLFQGIIWSRTAFTRLYSGDCLPTSSAAKMRSALALSEPLRREQQVSRL
ncbi:MAG: hypothetical protein KME25_25255 [Symplocastrum torsivum CPER-KK1]|uniref:Uncharacterized protein n=1 Tax=Symplocastrum torsivum CPER-KK1 TaxID=450513 RepID=A0A951UCA1_9CYAN|nr:hypothetical protein [Symplocastrum torsivum CPER-KK1]